MRVRIEVHMVLEFDDEYTAGPDEGVMRELMEPADPDAPENVVLVSVTVSEPGVVGD